jgi:hypothetical protein
MERRITRGSSAGQKRQVRMQRRRLEDRGVPKGEARNRAEARGASMRSGRTRSGTRMVSQAAEQTRVAHEPRKQGIRVRGGEVVLPRRLTAKRAEAVTSGGTSKKRGGKSRR